MDFDCDDDEDFLKVIEELEDQEDRSNVTAEPEPQENHIQCLQNSFGHSEFRPLQWKVIRSIIEDRRDNCCIMATGYGKSLCFQFPPVFANGMALIISPLISLMQDQVKSLNLVNIPSCMLGSAQTNKSIEDDVIKGKFRIVYASPEYLSGIGCNLIGMLKDKLTLIAVDEAHCISTWGQDFRPKYLELKNVRNAAPDVPILAVTATASDRVQQDICTNLRLRNPQIICTGFDRPNLEILVRRKSKEPWDDMGHILRSKLLSGASCIVYCLTRKITDQISEEFKSHGLKCGAYHAGKTQNQRKEVFDQFIRDELNVIVATVAFGMGIDKSDVRCVIHYGAPSDIDSYYQEIGRAGRDGVQSKCILFYSEGDFEIHRHLRNNSRLSEAALRKAEHRSSLMSDFIYTKQCRRLKILQYFDGPSAKSPNLAVCCDNCRLMSSSANTQNISETIKEIDFSEDARLLLNVISLFGGYSGISKPIALMRGSKLKTIERYHNHKLMGSGKHKSEQYWKTFADALERNNLLERQVSKPVGTQYGFTTVKVSSRGQSWLESGTPLKFIPPEQLSQLIISERSVSATSATKPLYDTSSASLGTLSIDKISNKSDVKPNKENEELKRSLMVVRAMIASREGTMPYKIASEPAIDRLVQMKPLNLQELRDAKVDGFSETLLKQFGPEFLNCILRSRGLLPLKSTENVDEKLHTSNITEVSSTTSDNKIEFEDDDELFINLDFDCEKLGDSSNAQKPVESKVEKKVVRVTTTASKRVKYENSSSDEETESISKGNDTSCPKTSVQNPPNPPKPVGIRKRNIF